MKKTNEILLELKNIVSKSENGHLPLVDRIQLAKSVNDSNVINKVYLECIKLLLRETKESDSTILNILIKAENMLYDNEKYDFQKIINEHHNYLLSFPECDLQGVATSTFSLLYSLVYNAESTLNIEDYSGEDDTDLEPLLRLPDFFASIAYSNNEILEKKEFWNYFLDIYTQVINNERPSKKLIQAKVENHFNFKRNKDHNTDSIETLLEKVIHLLLNDVNESWDYIYVEGQDMGGKGLKAYAFKDGEKHKINHLYYLQSGDNSSVTLMSRIKKEIYLQSPKQGTWFSYYLKIYPDKNYEISYNYDEFKIYKDISPRKDNFIMEFESFPRAKEYTPKWLQEIVNNRELYLLE